MIDTLKKLFVPALLGAFCLMIIILAAISIFLTFDSPNNVYKWSLPHDPDLRRLIQDHCLPGPVQWKIEACPSREERHYECYNRYGNRYMVSRVDTAKWASTPCPDEVIIRGEWRTEND